MVTERLRVGSSSLARELEVLVGDGILLEATRLHLLPKLRQVLESVRLNTRREERGEY